MDGHGSDFMYKSGCRCDPCRAAHAARVRANRAERLAAGRFTHGTRVGYDCGCRCDECVTAYMAANRARIYARWAKHPTPVAPPPEVTTPPDPDPSTPWWARPDRGCANVDTNTFYPRYGESDREAKRLCRGCPVRGECLDDALLRGEPFGVWGGLTSTQRRKQKKRTAA